MTRVGRGNGRKPLLVPGVEPLSPGNNAGKPELHSADRNVGQRINSPAVLLWSQHTRILPFWTQQGLTGVHVGCFLPVIPGRCTRVPNLGGVGGVGKMLQAKHFQTSRVGCRGKVGCKGVASPPPALGRPASPLLETVPWKQQGSLALLARFQMWWT